MKAIIGFFVVVAALFLLVRKIISNSETESTKFTTYENDGDGGADHSGDGSH